MKGKLALTPRGRVTLLLVHLTASAAFLTQQTFAQLATAALAAPLLVDLLWKLAAAPRISIAVRARRTRAGDLFLESLLVHNESRRAAAHALEVGEPATGVRRGNAWIETLPAGTSASIDLPARVRRRGIRAERSFAVATSYPFDMLRWSHEPSCPSRIVAEPARTELSAAVLARLDAASREPQRAGAMLGPEFFALREYRAGDDARLVHGRRSASVGTLVARDLRGSHDSDAVLVVDLRRTPGRGYHFGDRRIDPQLSLAATLFDELRARQTTPTCVVIGPGIRSWRVASSHDAESFLDVLAEARAVPHFRVDEAALSELCRRGTAFWVAAGGYAADRDRERLPDVVVMREDAS